MLFPRNGLCILLLLLSPLTFFAQFCAGGVQADGETVEISGRLHSQVEWGPPNFGENPETDSRWTAWILSTKEPIPVQGGAQIGGSSYGAVFEVQLQYIGSKTVHADELQSLDGKMVVATGTLWRGTVEGDVTAIVMTLGTVGPTDKAICRIVSGN